MNAEDHGVNNAKAWWENIKEMVCRLENAQEADDSTVERVEQDIHESVLSVEVRSLWYAPGQPDSDNLPGEYRILLTTGGPALQITGDLNEHGEPETAELEHQDWGIPWTRSYPEIYASEVKAGRNIDWNDYQETLLTFCRCFYFGAG